MNKEQREIQLYAEEIGQVAQTCHYFEVGRAKFYRWHKANSERHPKQAPGHPTQMAVNSLICINLCKPTALRRRSFISGSTTRVISTSRPNWTYGSALTTSTDRMVLAMKWRLTKLSEKL